MLNWYVNGEAAVYINSDQLGVSVDGVSVRNDIYLDPIFADTRGDHVPSDYLYFLVMFTITTDLVWFDWDLLQQSLTGLVGTDLAYGTWGSAGTLLLTSSNTARLTIKSQPEGLGETGQAKCWQFPNAFLIDAQEIKLGTVRSIWRLKWQCNTPYDPASTDGQTLMQPFC